MGSRHEEPTRPRTWYPPITHSIPSAYFGKDAFKPTLEPAFVARSARNVGPSEGSFIDGAPRVRVVDDPAPPVTSKHVEFIRSLRCLPREREEDAAARRTETLTRGPYGFPVGDATTLWNRDPTGAPVHVGARQHIPMLTLTPDVTTLLGRIAAEVTTEANEARRLRALEEDDDHDDDDDDYSDDSSTSTRFYKKAHLAGVLSTRDVKYDDYTTTHRRYTTRITLDSVRDPKESSRVHQRASASASAVVIETSVLEDGAGEDERGSDDDSSDDEDVSFAARLDEAAWRGGSADEVLYARCAKRVALRPASVLPMQAAAATIASDRRSDESVSPSIAVTAAMQLPNAMFRVTPITPPALSPVPLAGDLARLQREWKTETETQYEVRDVPIDECATGFLTLDEAKRLVPLTETDPKAFEVPVIGVWVAGAKHPAHLGVWSAMLRFAAHDGFKRKVTSGPDRSFVLAMYPPGINAVPGKPAVYDCVTIPGTEPFARYVARVRCAPGDAGEAPFVPTDAEGTKLVQVSPMKRTPEKDANERYASVPDDDDDDNTTYDGAASERTYGGGGGATSERGVASRSRDEYMSPLSKFGYNTKQTTSPPQAPPGWAVGNTLTPKYTEYEVTARRHAALRAVADASLDASRSRGESSYVPSARASIVSTRGYYGAADDVVRTQQAQITELASAVKTLRAEIAARAAESVSAAASGGVIDRDGTIDRGTKTRMSGEGEAAEASGAPDVHRGESTVDTVEGTIQKEADSVGKPEESSDDDEVEDNDDDEEETEVELKTPSPEPELTEKERRKLEKRAKKEEKRAKKETKKSRREAKKAKKKGTIATPPIPEDEPMFTAGAEHFPDSIDAPDSIGGDAPTPSPEPDMPLKEDKSRLAAIEAKYLGDIDPNELELETNALKTSQTFTPKPEIEPPEGCPPQPARTHPRGTDPYVELDDVIDTHGDRWADPMPGLHDPDGPHPRSPELEFCPTGIPLGVGGGVDVDATDSDEDESIVHDLLKAQLVTPLTEMDDETAKRKAAAHEAYTVGKVAVSMDNLDETEGFHAMLDRATRLDLNPMYPIIDYTEEAEGSGDEDEEIVAKYVAAGIGAEEEAPEVSEEGTEEP